MLIYSGIFPYLKLTVQSSCEGMPLLYCKSRGLSRAFAEIIRLNFSKAISFNPYSIRIFAFALFQLIIRFISNLWLIEKFDLSKIIVVDSVITFSTFIFSFLPLVLI